MSGELFEVDIMFGDDERDKIVVTAMTKDSHIDFNYFMIDSCKCYLMEYKHLPIGKNTQLITDISQDRKIVHAMRIEMWDGEGEEKEDVYSLDVIRNGEVRNFPMNNPTQFLAAYDNDSLVVCDLIAWDCRSYYVIRNVGQDGWIDYEQRWVGDESEKVVRNRVYAKDINGRNVIGICVWEFGFAILANASDMYMINTVKNTCTDAVLPHEMVDGVLVDFRITSHYVVTGTDNDYNQGEFSRYLTYDSEGCNIRLSDSCVPCCKRVTLSGEYTLFILEWCKNVENFAACDVVTADNTIAYSFTIDTSVYHSTDTMTFAIVNRGRYIANIEKEGDAIRLNHIALTGFDPLTHGSLVKAAR